MTDSAQLDLAIIGAGPSGLLMSKQAQDAGINFKVFERNSNVGGIWDIEAPNSPMYQSAHFISSKTLSGFPDFPMPEDYPDYPNHKQLLAYIRSYADHYNLKKHIQFNTEIVSASFVEANNNDHWLITFTDGTTQKARYLVCANGITWNPNEVSWPGSFNGEIRHSVTYKSPDEFLGKKVLVVGAGNSGVDIACDASFAAEQAYLSVRRGYYFLPKHIMGKPADVFNEQSPPLPLFLKQKIFSGLLHLINGDMRRYGLPKPDHKVFETHPIMNTQVLHYLAHGDCIAKPDVKELDGNEVIFTDGSREEIDVIITATGYKHNCPFLDQDQITVSDSGHISSYLNIFPRDTKQLAILGFINFASAAYKHFSSMAELIIADIKNQHPKLTELKATHHPDLTGGQEYVKSHRHADYVDVKHYLKVLKSVKKDIGLIN